MHSECASSRELPEAKAICLLCKEDQQPVAKTYMVEMQTREEITSQTDADIITKKQANLLEVTPGQKGTSVRDQSGDEPEKELPMDTGRSEFVHNMRPSLQGRSVMTCHFMY